MGKLGRKRKPHRFMGVIEQKHCSRCNKWCALKLFHKSKQAWDGLHNICKSCGNENSRLFHERNAKNINHKRRNGKHHTFKGIKPHVFIGLTEHKECYSCKKIAMLNEFNKCSRNWDLLTDLCRTCNKAKSKAYYQANKEKIRTKSLEWQRKKMISDPMFRLVRNLRNRVWSTIKRGTKSARTLELLGCDILTLKKSLEANFLLGMTWENYGQRWHVDHIIPCAKFDLSLASEQRTCFNYTNLQPLWAEDNLAKGSKV